MARGLLRPVNFHFTTVLRADEREVTRGLLRRRDKFAFDHSFEL